MIRWPWHRLPPSEHELEESRRALQEAHVWVARTRRLAAAADRAIIQNHFARDMKEAWQANENPR